MERGEEAVGKGVVVASGGASVAVLSTLTVSWCTAGSEYSMVREVVPGRLTAGRCVVLA